ncbi:MAG: cytosine permease [Myxococcota bacterium]
MTHKSEEFGSAGLISPELKPVPERQHPSLKISPSSQALRQRLTLYPLTAQYVGLSRWAVLAGTAAAMFVCVGLAWVYTRTASRYGVGFTIVCRAAFGPRGAVVVVSMRWLAAVIWLGSGVRVLAEDLVWLLKTRIRWGFARIDKRIFRHLDGYAAIGMDLWGGPSVGTLAPCTCGNVLCA